MIGGGAGIGLETARQARAEGADVALDGHLMTNTALTGAAYDVDGGQQIVPGA